MSERRCDLCGHPLIAGAHGLGVCTRPHARRTREHIEGQPCTPRCADLHALDCPNYRGPLSRTGVLTAEDHGEVAREGRW